MPSEAQLNANRANALKSTGPKTPAGKTRSSQNALKHGLRSQNIVVPGENPKDFEELLMAFHDAYQPQDPVEETLIRQMAMAEFRLLRFARAEAGLFWFRYNYSDLTDRPYHPAPPKTEEEKITYRHGRALQTLSGPDDNLASLARYDSSARRAFFQALQTLEGRRQLHAANNPEPPLTTLEPEPIPEPLKLLPAKQKLPNEPNHTTITIDPPS